MKKIIAIIALFLASASCACNKPNVEHATDPQLALQSTVKVYATFQMHIPGVEEVPERTISGSGVVINQEPWHHGYHTLIATAKHVCEGRAPSDSLKAMGVTVNADMMIERYLDGAKFKVHAVHLGFDNDICFLSADALVARPAPIAMFYPPIGARVIWTGAPKGLWDSAGKLGIITEGLYSGISIDDFHEPLMVFGSTATHGNSGGPIWYDGKVFGILVATSTEAGVIVLGVPLAIIHKEHAIALEKWRK